MDIQVGDKITYMHEEDFVLKASCQIVTDTTDVVVLQNRTEHKEIEIIKIERICKEGWYTVYEKEEKKELLTKEEKDFLKLYIKMSSLNITHIEKSVRTYECMLVLYEDCLGNCTYYNKNYFEGLEIDKKYTLSELGLEEN